MRTRTFTGVAQSSAESELSFKVGGTVTRILVNVGNALRAGDVIAELDPSDFDVRVEEAQAQLRRVEAAERNARAAYERTEALYEENNASLSDLDVDRANYESTVAEVESATRTLELTQRERAYTRLRSPSDGLISAVDSERGENIQAGQRVVLLTAGAKPEVEISVPGALIGGVSQGDTATVRFDAIANQSFPATVTEVAVAAIDAASAFPVKVQVSSENGAIRPGMAAEVDLTFDAAGSRDRYLVRPAAVGEDNAGRFGFVVRHVSDGVGTAHRVLLETGDLTSRGLEVFSGFEDGDLVVTAGVSQLVNGESVRLWGESKSSQ